MELKINNCAILRFELMIRIIFGFFLLFFVVTFLFWLSKAKNQENLIKDFITNLDTLSDLKPEKNNLLYFIKSNQKIFGGVFLAIFIFLLFFLFL